MERLHILVEQGKENREQEKELVQKELRTGNYRSSYKLKQKDNHRCS
jgi:hypothetical protein